MRNFPPRMLVLTLCLAMGSSGCYGHLIIAPEEFVKMDGFRSGDEWYLRDRRLREWRIVDSTRVTLLVDSTRPIHLSLSRVEVDDEFIHITAVSGAQFKINRREFRGTQISRLSWWKSIGLVLIGVVFGAYVWSSLTE